MENEKFVRAIFYYRDYYLNFFSALPPDVQRKFNWTFKLVATVEKVPKSEIGRAEKIRKQYFDEKKAK